MSSVDTEIADALGKFWRASGFASQFAQDLVEGRVVEPTVDAANFVSGGFLYALRQLISGFDFVDEQITDVSLNLLEEKLEGLDLPPAAAKEIRQFLDGALDGSPILQMLFVGLSWIQTYRSVWDGYSLALKAQLAKAGLTSLRPSVGSVDDIVFAEAWQGEQFANKEELLGELGLPDRWYDLMRNARRNWPDVSTVIELFNRGLIDDNTFDLGLKYNRIDDPNVIEHWRELRHPRLSFPELVRARYRALLPGEEYESTKDTYGYKPEVLAQIEALQKPILGVGEVLELFRRNQLGDRLDTLPFGQATQFNPDTGENKEVTLNGLLAAHGFSPLERHQFSIIAERIPTIQELFELWRKHHVDDVDLVGRLTDLGFKKPRAEQIADLRYFEATPSDLVSFGVKDAFDPQIVSTFGQDQENPRNRAMVGSVVADKFNDALRRSGLRPEAWDLNWIAHWRIPSPGQGFDMLHRGIISENELGILLKALDYPPFWRSRMRDLSFRLIPRRSLLAMLGAQVIDEQTAFNKFRALGYSPEDSSILLQEGVARTTEDLRVQTKSDILNAFERGIISEFTARGRLRDINYGEDAISAFIASSRLSILEQRGIITLEEDREGARNARLKTERDTLRALADGLIGKERADIELVNLGYSPETAESLSSSRLFERELDDREEAIEQFEDMVIARVMSEDDARGRLGTLGVATLETERLIKRWTLERERRERIAAKRDRKPTKADLADWVKKGIIDGDQYQSEMMKLGFPDEQILYYMQELLIDLEQVA